jgi:hypothetical protein
MEHQSFSNVHFLKWKFIFKDKKIKVNTLKEFDDGITLLDVFEKEGSYFQPEERHIAVFQTPCRVCV